MEIQCVGVGEASDAIRGNASVLIDSQTKLLIDCGFAVPALYLAFETNVNFLDAIYFTHSHADHMFGIAGLIVTWYAEKREKPLTIIGQPGTKAQVQQLIDLGYRGLEARMPFEIRYVETIDSCTIGELTLEFAKTEHRQSNYAVRVTNGDLIVGVSGDGGMTPESIALLKPCSIVVHEAYMLETNIKSHATAKEVVEIASGFPNLKVLALTHIQRAERQRYAKEIVALGTNKPFLVTIPEAGDRYRVT